MSDSEEKINLRGTIKAPAELVSRIQDETRRLRKLRGLTKDPAAWSVVSAAMDIYDLQERDDVGRLARALMAAAKKNDEQILKRVESALRPYIERERDHKNNLSPAETSSNISATHTFKKRA